MRKPRPIQVNVTFSQEQLDRLRQFCINETTRLNKVVSMNSLIREAIEEKIARDSGKSFDHVIGVHGDGSILHANGAVSNIHDQFTAKSED